MDSRATTGDRLHRAAGVLLAVPAVVALGSMATIVAAALSVPSASGGDGAGAVGVVAVAAAVAGPGPWVAVRTFRGEYGPLGISLGAIHAGGALVVVGVLVPGSAVPVVGRIGPLVSLAATAVPVLLGLSVAVAGRGTPFPTDRFARVHRWVYRAGWLPWVGVVPAATNLLAGRPIESTPLGVVAVTALAWLATAAYAQLAAPEAARTFQKRVPAGDDAGDGDPGGPTPETFVLTDGYGGLPLSGPRWLVATRVTVAESELRVHETALFDLQTLSLFHGARPRTLAYDRIEGVDYRDSRLTILATDGEAVTVRSRSEPEGLLAAVRERVRDRSERPSVRAVTGRRPGR